MLRSQLSSDAPITHRQQGILRAIDSYREQHGYGPSVRDLCELTGLPWVSGMIKHLRSLERRGSIKRGLATARSVTLTERGRLEMRVALEGGEA